MRIEKRSSQTEQIVAGLPPSPLDRPRLYIGGANRSSAKRRRKEEAAIAACDGIIDLLSVFFNVCSRQLRSSGRTPQPVSRVRQIGMYVAHVTLGMQLTAIGAGFGRDKSTVMHACHMIEDLRDDPEFDAIMARVEKLVAVAFSVEQGVVRRDD